MNWSWVATAWAWLKTHWIKVLIGVLTLGAAVFYLRWRSAREDATQAKIDLAAEKANGEAREKIAAGNALDEVRAGMERARDALKAEAQAVDATTKSKIQEGASDGADRIAADFNKRN